jgi:hypothetical protein
MADNPHMGRFLLAYCLVVIGLCVAVAAQTSAETMQGRTQEFSCLTFPLELSHAALSERDGPANVRSAPVFGVDDGPQDGTVVFADRDPMKLEIVWRNSQTKTNPDWVRTRENGSRWRTTHGIMVGMDLKTIERMNRRPFRLARLFGLNPGLIDSRGAGELEKFDAKGCKVRITVSGPGDGPKVPWSLQKQVQRGGIFSSGHPAMQALNPKVSEIYLSHD